MKPAEQVAQELAPFVDDLIEIVHEWRKEKARRAAEEQAAPPEPPAPIERA